MKHILILAMLAAMGFGTSGCLVAADGHWRHHGHYRRPPVYYVPARPYHRSPPHHYGRGPRRPYGPPRHGDHHPGPRHHGGHHRR